MSKLFKITGIVSFILCFGLLVYLLFTVGPNVPVILSVVASGILGLSLIAVGDLMDRVDYLEETLKIDQSRDEQEETIQHVTCPNCKKQYDMDYPKCPHCGHVN